MFRSTPPIFAIFNKFMDPFSLTSETFILKQGSTLITGSVFTLGAESAFVPDSDLTPNTLYEVTITTGAKDMFGNPLAANYVWTFTTSGAATRRPPTVVVTHPFNGETLVPVTSFISVVFN